MRPPPVHTRNNNAPRLTPPHPASPHPRSASTQVTHLATAASAATTALDRLSQHPATLQVMAAHPLTAPALSYMLEEHSYVRLKLLFPGLLQSERPRSARPRPQSGRSPHAAQPPPSTLLPPRPSNSNPNANVNNTSTTTRVEYNPAVHRAGRTANPPTTSSEFSPLPPVPALRSRVRSLEMCGCRPATPGEVCSLLAYTP